MNSLRILLSAGAAFAALSAGEALACSVPQPAPTPSQNTPCTKPPGAGAATINNEQINLDSAFSEFKLKVQSATNASASAVTGGNIASVGVSNGPTNVTSNQEMMGATTAKARSEVATINGASVTTAYAVSNGLAAGAVRGNVTANARQVTGTNAPTTANAFGSGMLNGANTLGAVGATASANVANLGANRGDVTGNLTQESNSNVSANSKGEFCCNNGSAQSGAVASANNATYTGTTTTMRAYATQRSNGEAVTAVSDLWTGGNANVVVGGSTANGNAMTVVNEWGWQDMRATQSNQSNIMSQSWVTVNNANAAASNAFGVGNTAVISGVGSDMRLNFNQSNNGRVQAWSALSANGGVGTGVVTATAIGNASSAFLCTQCGDGAMTGGGVQVNNARVEAVGTLIAPNATNVSGAASAFGNVATYQVGGGH
jgi:hypothetical protein